MLFARLLVLVSLPVYPWHGLQALSQVLLCISTQNCISPKKVPYPKYWSQAKQQQNIQHLSYISSQKFSPGLTNKLVCLRNASNLLTVSFEHFGRVLSAKHLSLYSAMVFTNISTSSKDASWIYWANAMMVLQQSTQSTQWWPAEFPVMSNQNLIGTLTCWLTLKIIKMWSL